MKKFRAMRPEGIYEKVLRQRKIDGIKFYEENSKSFVEVDCPACNSKRKEEKFEKWGYNHCICQECSTLYCSPRPTDKQLGYFYNSYEAPKMWTELLVSADVSRKKISILQGQKSY
ncbi:MAG: hypothetical protein JJT76_10475 [Clostridiaceae bacterium]|nr:hypothetical protein [Clostridiaceae bacterium]